MTPERTEQERKAFEAWYTETYLPTPVHGRTFSKYPSGTYCLQHVQDGWQAWMGKAGGWISTQDGLPPHPPQTPPRNAALILEIENE